MDGTLRLWDLRSPSCQVRRRHQPARARRGLGRPRPTLQPCRLLFHAAQGLLQLSIENAAAPVAAFDNQGLIFAVGVNSQYVNLYDARNFERVRCRLVPERRLFAPSLALTPLSGSPPLTLLSVSHGPLRLPHAPLYFSTPPLVQGPFATFHAIAVETKANKANWTSAWHAWPRRRP